MRPRFRMLIGFMVMFVAASAVANEPSDDLTQGVAERVLQVVDVVQERHVDPPTRQGMLFEVARQAFALNKRPVPIGLGRRISGLTDREREIEFLADTFRQLVRRSDIAPGKLYETVDRTLAVALKIELSNVAEHKVSEQLAANRYVGIGITLTLDRATQRPQMNSIIPGGPADRSVAQARDLILSVDGISTKGKSLREAVQMLRGKEGSELALVLRQPKSDDLRECTLTRGVVPILHVTNYKVHDESGQMRVAYLSVGAITASTVHELETFEKRMRADKVGGVLFDLQGARSARLHDTLLLADALLDGGPIGRVRTVRGDREYAADRDCLFRGLKLAVLVNQTNAGPVEWLTCALQDNGRATVIGSPTAGRGYAVEGVPVPDTGLVAQIPTAVLARANGEVLIAPVANLSNSVTPPLSVTVHPSGKSIAPVVNPSNSVTPPTVISIQNLKNGIRRVWTNSQPKPAPQRLPGRVHPDVLLGGDTDQSENAVAALRRFWSETPVRAE